MKIHFIKSSDYYNDVSKFNIFPTKLCFQVDYHQLSTARFLYENDHVLTRNSRLIDYKNYLNAMVATFWISSKQRSDKITWKRVMLLLPISKNYFSEQSK